MNKLKIQSNYTSVPSNVLSGVFGGVVELFSRWTSTVGDLPQSLESCSSAPSVSESSHVSGAGGRGYNSIYMSLFLAVSLSTRDRDRRLP